jgi:hypothetical protein
MIGRVLLRRGAAVALLLIAASHGSGVSARAPASVGAACVDLPHAAAARDGGLRAVPAGSAPALPGTPRIGRIEVRRLAIFDESDPAEDVPLYRLANDLHLLTREQAVLELLPFASGDVYDWARLREGERLLRNRDWAYDARVVPVRRCGDLVDVMVVTRDVWSIVPTGDINRSGGESSLALGIKDVNLLGRGETLGLYYEDGVDRTGIAGFYVDPFVGGTPWLLRIDGGVNDDGERIGVNLQRPYRSFDDRASHGVVVARDERIQPRFDTGFRVEEFAYRSTFADLFLSRSTGVRDGVVHRWRVGMRYQEHEFARTDTLLQPAELPEDRRFAYPYVAYEFLEERWDASVNLNFVQLTEDVFLGRRFAASFGLAPDGAGADAGRALLDLDYRDALRAGGWLLSWNGRVDGALRFDLEEAENLVVSAGTQAFHRHNDAFGFFAGVDGVWTRNLTGERQLLLGGDNGLRAYPQRYQEGDRLLRLRLEERWFSSLHPFQLFRLGAAVFLDAGRAWFPGAPDDEEQGWLANVGLGLRLTSDRVPTDSIMHIDIATPLRRGGRDVDDVLVSVTLRESF